MFKRVILFAVIVLAVVALAACGGGDEKPEEAAPAEQAQPSCRTTGCSARGACR